MVSCVMTASSTLTNTSQSLPNSCSTLCKRLMTNVILTTTARQTLSRPSHSVAYSNVPHAVVVYRLTTKKVMYTCVAQKQSKMFTVSNHTYLRQNSCLRLTTC